MRKAHARLAEVTRRGDAAEADCAFVCGVTAVSHECAPATATCAYADANYDHGAGVLAPEPPGANADVAAARTRTVALRRGAAGDVAALESPRRFYDAVLAVDAAYHFGAAEEARFSPPMSSSRGVFAAATSASARARPCPSATGSCSGPATSTPAVAARARAAAAAGFSDAAAERSRVLDRWPFLGALPLDYVVVRATVAAGSRGALRRRRRRGPRPRLRAGARDADATVFERAAHVGFASQSVAMAGASSTCPCA
ncbi:hypothetical protein JL720_16 [Aureococcus anophagefferens]|nr:hypothetical protein JL720_16 [Aureococcus anophagefferens]